MPALTRYRYAPPKGPVAAHPSAYGEEFAVAMMGGPAFAEVDGVAVVSISGPLEQHGGWLCDSYDNIRERFAAALASQCQTVALRINSPGGDFAGSIELSREMRSAAAAAGKRLVSFTDSQALSAGYILACAGETITITPSAFVGSIGVWAPIVDETASDRAQGLNVVIVASGARKVDSNPHVAITEDAVSAMQVQVDAMASLFFGLVEECRGMPSKAIIGLQGSQQFGSAAHTLHLADNIVNSWGDFLTSLKGVSLMAKSYGATKQAYRDALAKVAEGDDEDAKAAQKALAAFEKEDADEKAAAEDMKKKDEDGDADASAKASEDEEAKAAAAKAEFDKKEEKAAARGNLRVVASATATELDLAARLHAIEVERSNEKEAIERKALLDTRPDFSASVRKVLATANLATLKAAVKDFPRGSLPSAADAITPGGTRGETQGNANEQKVTRDGMPAGFVGMSEADFITQAMHRGPRASEGVVHNGRELVLGYMTPEEAKAKLKAMSDKGAVK